jgi:penicillin-binding protein 2
MMDIRQPEDLRQLRPRLQAMVLLVLLAFIALLGRLCQLQVLEGEHYVRKAERNFIDTIEVPAPRGRIFDAQGRPLASNRPAYTLYVTPRPRSSSRTTPAGRAARVPLTDEQIDALADLLDFVDKDDRAEFEAKITDRRDVDAGYYPLIVRSNLSWAEYARIQTRKSRARRLARDPRVARRYYPAGELTAFVTGYVGEVTPDGLARPGSNYRPGDRVGKTGIERQWENYLRGRPGKRSRVVDNRHRPVKDPPARGPGRAASRRGSDPRPGHPPDPRPRPAAGRRRGVRRQARRRARGDGRAHRQDPRHALGPRDRPQPLAAADRPRAVRRLVASPLKPFIDRTVQEHYFPGSTYKVVSALAALDDPTFDPEEEITCEGFINYGGRKFKCTHKHGPVNLEQAIVQSCNSYFYTLAIDKGLDLEAMERFARRLGLGERTGLGLNSEAKGRIPTEAFEAREGTYQRGVRLNSAIGQGNVTATVLQIAVMYAAIANGGEVLTPYLVDRSAPRTAASCSRPRPSAHRPRAAPARRPRPHPPGPHRRRQQTSSAPPTASAPTHRRRRQDRHRPGRRVRPRRRRRRRPARRLQHHAGPLVVRRLRPRRRPADRRRRVRRARRRRCRRRRPDRHDRARVLPRRSSSQPGGPQPRRTGVPPPLPGQRAREEAQREDSTVPSPDREVALTGARLPGDRPLVGDLIDGKAPDLSPGPGARKPGKPGKHAHKEPTP